MCHFITAVLPKEADAPKLDAIARKHDRQFEPLSNSSIEAQLRQGERYFLTTLGHCDCGTSLGASVRDEFEVSRDHHTAIERLRTKGWSETKISRWIKQKQHVSDRDDRVRSTSETSRANDWRGLIEDVLDSRLTPYMGILLHMYSGSLSARIHLAGRQVLVLSDLTDSTLAEIKEDVIYEFKRGRP